MRMISYAQNGEDVLLDRLFPRDPPGFYVDVGANDPVFHSVTKHFHDLGWSGVNVEPQPLVHDRLARQRIRDVNLNIGLSDREGTRTLYEIPTLDGWSTFSAEFAATARTMGHAVVERVVPVTTLAALCALYVGERRTIDFLKIDVEHHEREVIAGGDWSRFRPRVVMVETNGWTEWEPVLLAADYLYATFDGLNRYYVRHEDRHLLPTLAVPVNVTDEAVPSGYHERIERLSAELAEFDGLSRPSRALVRRWCRVERGCRKIVATFRSRRTD